jgi:general secretion pathway protein K
MAGVAVTSRLMLLARDRGAAIVMAMLLAALAATIAATLLWQQQRWAGEHERRRDQVQAQVLAMAGVQWARQILFDNTRASTIVHLGQPWAFRLPPTPIENGSIGGDIVDAQARINMDNLAAPANASAPTHAMLERLFALVGAPLSMLNAITDWVDPDDQVSEGGGAEDAYYLAGSVPGLAANAPVRRVAELLAVRGADPAMLDRLRPFVAAVDAPATINVNTAPPEVLMAAIGGLDAATAAALVASRAQNPYLSIADFRARLPRGDLRIDETLLAVRSDWFLVTIEAIQGDTLARARALLKRSGAGTEWPIVVWQTVE